MDIDTHLNMISDEQTRRALRAIFAQLITDLNASLAAYAAHTHGCDGAAAGDYYSSPPATNTQTDGPTDETSSALVQTLTV